MIWFYINLFLNSRPPGLCMTKFSVRVCKQTTKFGNQISQNMGSLWENSNLVFKPSNGSNAYIVHGWNKCLIDPNTTNVMINLTPYDCNHSNRMIVLRFRF